jgi:hypothetical protein
MNTSTMIALAAGLALAHTAAAGPACGIFVSKGSGADLPTAGLSASDPVESITFGIQRAIDEGLGCVFVQAGGYPGVVNLGADIEIIGGFDGNWIQDDYTAPGHETRIIGGVSTIIDEFTTIAIGAGASVGLTNLVIEGPDAMGTRGSSGLGSYAVHVSEDGDVLLQNVRIEAGDGAPGEDGEPADDAPQTPAPSGFAGLGGQDSSMCSSSTTILGQPGPTNGGDTNTRGGSGGTAGRPDSNCSPVFPDLTPTRGFLGGDGAQAAGPFGRGGDAGVLPCNSGAPGFIGLTTDGTPGAGGAEGSHMLAAWFTNPGVDGTTGLAGGGGGGGGGSAGCDSGGNFFGATGGTGGAGGFPAPTAGEGGHGGGGSFGVYLAAGDALLIDVEIIRGVGGEGGHGGDGGAGQPGGQGGAPRQSASGVFSGAGGDGGRGGNSGAGGGGAGGPSVGVFDATFSNATLISTTISGGAGGQGGLGGQGSSPIDSLDGEDGADGLLLSQLITAGRAEGDATVSSITPEIINQRLSRGLSACDPAPCSPATACPADLSGDGVVGAADLAQLIGAWGACP